MTRIRYEKPTLCKASVKLQAVTAGVSPAPVVVE